MIHQHPSNQFAYASPHDAIDALLNHCVPVASESVALADSMGRVLREAVQTDRDSPPHDVSAMDGYAVRAESLDASGVTLKVQGEIAIGRPPPAMPGAGCFKIGTGACVPAGCDGVIPREQVDELPGSIRVPRSLGFVPGQHIRRRAENMKTGETVVPPGTAITPPIASALSGFGYEHARVARPVRVTILTTGDELLTVGAKPEPWQIRDSNGWTLRTGLGVPAWIEIARAAHVQDDRAAMTEALLQAASASDLVVTTGGVSMGDHDYVKPALLDAGGSAVYHRLPIRPGKPGLGGLVPDPTDVSRASILVALPGNPVAVAVGIPLCIGPVARSLAGFAAPVLPRCRVQIINPPERRLALWRYLPARLRETGDAELLATKGSGDLAGAATADGYVEMPPDAEGLGPWVFYYATL